MMCKDTKNCFTCAAFKTTQCFKDDTFDTKNSSIVTYWKDQKGIHGFETLTRAQKISQICGFHGGQVGSAKGAEQAWSNEALAKGGTQ
eukprot:3221014-Heterocapsa_arctica.AAC.1